MTRILLARHGETDWNVAQRFQGHADPPLNARGREQALRLAEQLATEPISAIYASDLRRALETAEIVAASRGLSVQPHPGLREVDVGEFQGLTNAEVDDRFPGAQDRLRTLGYGWERGESYDAMAERALSALREIASAYPDDQVLAVVHGGNIRAVLAHADRLDIISHRRVIGPAENCGVYPIEIRDGEVRRLD